MRDRRVSMRDEVLHHLPAIGVMGPASPPHPDLNQSLLITDFFLSNLLFSYQPVLSPSDHISRVCPMWKRLSLRGSILILEHPEVFTVSYPLKLTSYIWHMQMRPSRKRVLWEFLGWLLPLTALCESVSDCFSCVLWSGSWFCLHRSLKRFFSETLSCFYLPLCLYFWVSQHSARCDGVKAASLR